MDALLIIAAIIVALPVTTLLTGWMFGFPVLQWIGLRKSPHPHRGEGGGQ